MSDFEKASRNAIEFHFPNVLTKGCWFHYRQAIFRKAVKIGIKKFYHLDQYRDFLNLFGALALIPESKVLEGFEFIKTNFEKKWIKSKLFILKINFRE